ncbi:hypothetical protein MYX76_04470 [Desulfobacterota bacterium AH_259_B03_O07]|nr:hypothetical protein [Desulfobacterota bacterium AH_259_B03_O07]
MLSKRSNFILTYDLFNDGKTSENRGYNAIFRIYESPALPLSYAAKINVCRRLGAVLRLALNFQESISWVV